jgi:hypothetical protein
MTRCICITPADPRHPVKRIIHPRCPDHGGQPRWEVTDGT